MNFSSDYRIHFWYMRKGDAINAMKNCSLKEKKMDRYTFFSLYIKMSETSYCQRYKEKILNRTKEYYENDKKNIEIERELCNDKKDIKRECGRNRYHNISVENKKD